MDNVLCLLTTLVVCAFLWFGGHLLKSGGRRLRVGATVARAIACLLALGSLVFAFLPPIPCKPTRVSVGGRHGVSGGIMVDTLNFALPYFLALVVFTLALAVFLLYRITPAFQKDWAERENRRHRKNARSAKRNQKSHRREEEPSSAACSGKQRVLFIGLSLLFFAFAVLLTYQIIAL